MSISANIKFTQGATTAAPGTSVIGITGASVVLSNGDDTNAVSWSWQLLDKPATSALSIGVILQGAAAATATFTPDVPGCYRVQLTVQSSNRSVQQTRVFGVRNSRGWLQSPYAADPSEMNFAGNARGVTAYTDEIYADLKTVADAGGGGSVTFAGDLGGSSSSQNVVSLGTGAASVSTAGIINWANTSTVTLGQSAVTTASTVAPPITISSASATGASSTGGDINLNVGSSTTGAAKFNFKLNGVLKGYVYSGGSCVGTGADGLSLWSAAGMQASLYGDQGLGLSANAGNMYLVSNLNWLFNQTNSTNCFVLGNGGGIYVGPTKVALFTQQDNTTASATASTLTVQAQNATGTTSTGADLELKTGTGTSNNGNLRITNVPTTTSAPSAGAGGALPATPAGYVSVTINGTVRKLPYY
jgi:hypothetical protein